ncbi:MAG: Rpn family recombination-promoting nuclease/putative transposase [Acaryochloridaceae cyanobacterium CSU_3_4]|nr:Rpn family recombination-promoting nuclease/putative transposase [Acaryochloridaceae cyanobacterium CSU_3_4]
MRRDAIFYQIFKRFPSLLFTLLEHPPEQARGYRFESVEVKEPTFRIDGVFLPPEDAASRVVYFSEFQFQSDELLYHRFFSESLLYLRRNPTLYDDWYGVVIFPSRSMEPSNTTIHRSLLNGPQVQRFYLDELGDPNQQPIGVSLMQLTIASEKQMADQAKQLMERVNREDTGLLAKNEIIEVATTIAVYKFTSLSREEVEAMLGIKLEESRIYQDLKEEVQAEMLTATVPILLKTGMTVEQIAQELKVEVEAVRQAVQENG